MMDKSLACPVDGDNQSRYRPPKRRTRCPATSLTTRRGFEQAASQPRTLRSDGMVVCELDRLAHASVI